MSYEREQKNQLNTTDQHTCILLIWKRFRSCAVKRRFTIGKQAKINGVLIESIAVGSDSLRTFSEPSYFQRHHGRNNKKCTFSKRTMGDHESIVLCYADDAVLVAENEDDL